MTTNETWKLIELEECWMLVVNNNNIVQKHEENQHKKKDEKFEIYDFPS